jgi:very-short-patch-repair endonuclease
VPPEWAAGARGEREGGRREVDFLWREQRLAVEIDSFAYHRGSVAFQDDRARDLDLRAEGFAIHRFSERQLEEEPGRVVADVARALARGGLSVAAQWRAKGSM